jgi:hypothetical protein
MVDPEIRKYQADRYRNRYSGLSKRRRKPTEEERRLISVKRQRRYRARIAAKKKSAEAAFEYREVVRQEFGSDVGDNPDVIARLKVRKGTKKALLKVPLFSQARFHDVLRFLIYTALEEGEPYKTPPYIPPINLSDLQGKRVERVLPDSSGLQFEGGHVLTIDALTSQRWRSFNTVEWPPTCLHHKEQLLLCPICRPEEKRLGRAQSETRRIDRKRGKV